MATTREAIERIRRAFGREAEASVGPGHREVLEAIARWRHGNAPRGVGGGGGGQPEGAVPETTGGAGGGPPRAAAGRVGPGTGRSPLKASASGEMVVMVGLPAPGAAGPSPAFRDEVLARPPLGGPPGPAPVLVRVEAAGPGAGPAREPSAADLADHILGALPLLDYTTGTPAGYSNAEKAGPDEVVVYHPSGRKFAVKVRELPEG